MTQAKQGTSAAAASAAAAYERNFVPALFAEWAPRVADAAEIVAGERVLDVGCGTGVLAREAARRVGSSGSVTGIDVNPGMLSVAARLAPQIRWDEGLAEELPYDTGSFDAVVSQFALMFFGDREAALREMWRVLRSGGRLAVAVWDTLEHTPQYATEVALIERHAGRAAANVLRAPFVLGDRSELSSLFDSAGIVPATIRLVAGTARFPSLRAMIEADIRAWFPLAGVEVDERVLEAIVADAEEALGGNVHSDGTVAFAMPAHITTASKG